MVGWATSTIRIVGDIRRQQPVSGLRTHQPGRSAAWVVSPKCVCLFVSRARRVTACVLLVLCGGVVVDLLECSEADPTGVGVGGDRLPSAVAGCDVCDESVSDSDVAGPAASASVGVLGGLVLPVRGSS